MRECALFVPIISATTEGRREGYFRREWKLAAERTHDMGKRAAFVVGEPKIRKQRQERVSAVRRPAECRRYPRLQ